MFDMLFGASVTSFGQKHGSGVHFGLGENRDSGVCPYRMGSPEGAYTICDHPKGQKPKGRRARTSYLVVVENGGFAKSHSQEYLI